VTFDLKQSHPVSRAVLFYSGNLPRTIISGSDDGHEWRQLGVWPAHEAGTDVDDVAMTLDGSHRYLKLELAQPTSPGDKVILSEVEIWAHREVSEGTKP